MAAEKAHTIARRYLQHGLVFGNGLIQSIIILLKVHHMQVLAANELLVLSARVFLLFLKYGKTCNAQKHRILIMTNINN